MKTILAPYVLIPAVLLILVTLLRAWMEINAPESANLASANVLTLIWLVCAPAVMLKKGHSLLQGMIAALVVVAPHRLVIAGAYAMALSNEWTVADTTTPVRYVVQARDQFPGASPTEVFVQNAWAPIVFALVAIVVIWTITWAVAFRGKRSFAAEA